MADDKTIRRFDWELTRNDDQGDSRLLEGYAAVFNTWTTIDNSMEGRFNERISPGAFAKTIREHGRPVMQFDHGTHDMIGSIPIGVVQHLREDDRGLLVRARLSDNWLIQPVYDAIRDGAITGMSFRFTVNQDIWDHDSDGTPTRTITEIGRLWELGPVVWPAYADTTVGARGRELSAMLRNPDTPDLKHDLAVALTLGGLLPREADPEQVTSDDRPQPHLSDSEKERMAARMRRALNPLGV